jgi:hypothetical protein
MKRRADEKHVDALAEIKRHIENEDWEQGTSATFLALLNSTAGELSPEIDERFLEPLAAEIEASHRREQGMSAQFHDIAHQQALVELVAVTMRHTLATKGGLASSRKASRKTLIQQIDTLLHALQENIDVLVHRRNAPPIFDLALSQDEVFAEDIKSLVSALNDLRELLAQKTVPKKPKEISIARKALQKFSMSLAGTLGHGLGHTVTWGTRLALGYVTVAILKDLNVPVQSIIQALKENAFRR